MRFHLLLICFQLSAELFQGNTVAIPQAVEPGPIPESEQPGDAGFRDLPVINSSTRIPALDGLRGVAILLVLLCHSFVESARPAGMFLSKLRFAGRLTWSGVDLFFVLSGFLIGGILLDAKESPRYYKTFYARRAYRILPLYFVLLALFSLRYIPWHGKVGTATSFATSAIPWASYLTFTQNIWMSWLGTLGAPSMSATWSLAVEEQFYLTVPLLIRKIGKKRLALVLLSIVVAAPISRTLLNAFVDHGNAACFLLMPCRADALSLGVLCALLARSPRCWSFLLAHRRALCGVTGFFALGLIPLTYWDERLTTQIVTFGFSWLALFYTGCLLIAVTGASATIQRVLCNRILMRLGVLAYCTYLLHNPAMEMSCRLLRLVNSSESGQSVCGFIGVGLAIGVASVSWRFFEKPLLRRGHEYKY
jgi:peptidoglycan/LPS O-acetylase OafA/YrhL